MRKTYVISARYSAIDNFLGPLTIVKPVDLGTTVVKTLLEDGKVVSKQIGELLYGNVLNAGLGQNIGRRVALATGIPESVCSHSVNMVCGSGLRTVMEGVMSVRAGFSDIIVAGSAESVSGVPRLIPANTHTENKMGDFRCVDHVVHNALADAVNDIHMGITAENTTKKYNTAREMQDTLDYASQRKTITTTDPGHFKDEIIPVEMKLRKETTVFDTDEHPGHKSMPEKIAKLRPAFVKDGSVMAANASDINDGISFVLLANEEVVEKYNLTPLCEVVDIDQDGADPLTVGPGPTPAVHDVLKYVDMKLDKAELVELSETFAAQSLGIVYEPVEKHGIDREAFLEKTNVSGGAIALGHPVSALGNRILVTLTHEMIKRDTKPDSASLCIGGGQGTAVIVKRS